MRGFGLLTLGFGLWALGLSFGLYWALGVRLSARLTQACMTSTTTTTTTRDEHSVKEKENSNTGALSCSERKRRLYRLTAVQ